MYRIDDLITELHTDEVIELPGELTDDQVERIEKMIFSRIEIVTDTESKPRKFPRKKRSILLLAATLILILGITAFAAQKNEWDITLINFMGLNNSDVLQLEGGKVVINETTTSYCTDYSEHPQGDKKYVSITGISSIGDRNSAYLRINTDYELPKDFDETTDYILPETSSLNITYENIFGNNKFCSFGSTFTAFYENGKLGFLVSIENCENLNKCDVSIKIENLYWYHDLGVQEENDECKAEELLCEGSWEMKWRFSYKSNVKTQRMLKAINSNEGKYVITKVEASPISIRIEAVRNIMDRQKEWTGNILEEIHYKDGTYILLPGPNSGGLLNGIFIDEFVNITEIGEVLRPEEIEYLVICGQNVDM